MRRVILAICATAAGLVLLLSFKSHTQSAVAGASPAAALGRPAPEAAGGAAGSGTGVSGAAPSGAASAAGAAGAKTVTGDAAQTMYGPVQVQVTVKAGKLTAVSAVEYPSQDPRDAQINAYAIPQLNSEALAAGSAQIDAVSGASYTSQGYIQSLQSALDKAGI